MAKQDTCIILWSADEAPEEYKNLLSMDTDYIVWVEETMNDAGVLDRILSSFAAIADISNYRLDDGNWLYSIYLVV